VSAALHRAALAVILFGSFLLELHHLDHAAIKPLDEVFHAIVARNLLKHPLIPTLVDRPYLAYNASDWLTNHIWLHKPPMALWQIALSYRILGVNTLGLRFPSAVLATLAGWLTYLIGTEWLDRTAGLIAATLQAFNPVVLMLVHGYVFSDHVDISLLFWTELSIYFLARAARKGRRIDLILCGVAQGLAFLSKTFPALIVTGIALAAWLLSRTSLAGDKAPRLSGRGVAHILLATIATAGPWMAYTAVRFPDEFSYENLQILHHVNQNVENWAGPWDRLAFGYWISIFHVFYSAVLAAGIWAIVRAVQKFDLGLWLVIAWTLGVMTPHLLVTSKTMSATLVGWPPAWLLLGHLISRAMRGDRWALGIWSISMVLAAAWIKADDIPRQGWGPGPGGFGSIMLEHLWVTWHVLAALAGGALVALFLASARPWPRRGLTVVAGAAMLIVTVRWWKGNHPPGYFGEAVQVTNGNALKPDFSAIGDFAAKLPTNAAFIVDEQERLENKLIEFATDRSCYALEHNDWRPTARALTAAGALPYLITPDARDLPAVFVDAAQNRIVYACTPAARLAGAGK
jgi:4-amino-4-deoxy-L-arabinose transferase